MNNIAAGKNVDDMGESLNNVDKVLAKVGLSLKDETGQIRDLGDVLDEVAANWNTYTRNQQNQLSTAKLFQCPKNKAFAMAGYIEIYTIIYLLNCGKLLRDLTTNQ